MRIGMDKTKRIGVKEFMKLFNLREYTAYKLVRIFDFPSVKLGGRYYIDPDRAKDWMEEKEKQGVIF